jgi:hypothetical protein
VRNGLDSMSAAENMTRRWSMGWIGRYERGGKLVQMALYIPVIMSNHATCTWAMAISQSL